MMKEHRVADPTQLAPSEAGGPGLVLVIVGPASVETQSLPEQGTVTIGRSDRNIVQVDDPVPSREHARLHIDGGRLTIEDVGTVNGVRVDGEQIPPATLVPIRLGSTTAMGNSLFVIQRAPSPPPVQRPMSHEVFMARLGQTCSVGRPFAILRVHLDGAFHEDVHTTITEILGRGVTIGAFAPNELSVLLLGADRARAEEAAGQLDEGLAGAGVTAAVGVANFPADGRSPDALLMRSSPREPEVTEDPDEPLFIAEEMRALLTITDRLARGTINIMVLGETGAGKEILAETLHRRSPRRDRPFVRINCAALSDTLLESELFGHEKGAFTGAASRKVGLLEAADGGTVLLDEVGEMPAGLQASLLRAIERREVVRVGSVTPVPIDVRFVAATNRDLVSDAEGRFRRDLYYRLSGAVVTVPPLRRRTIEIRPLAERFVRRSAKQLDQPVPVLSVRALELLERYDWPGNVRELRNVMERAVLLAPNGAIEPEHLPIDRMQAAWHEPALLPGEIAVPSLSEADQAERARMVEALRACNGNQTRAAKMLDVPRRTFTFRMKKLGLQLPARRW